MGKRWKRAVDGLLLLFLVFVFTVPGAWLRDVCADMTANAQQAAAAVRAGEDAGAYLAELERIYEKTALRMRLFLNHSAVDELGAAIGVCVPEREESALLSALNAVQTAVAHVAGMESLGLDSIF